MKGKFNWKYSKSERRGILRNLREERIPADEIGSAIVRIAKPFDKELIQVAKDVVLTYLSHPDAWARHEAMWFLSWGGFSEYKSKLIQALVDDPDPDNRAFAASCLGHLFAGSSDAETISALKHRVEDDAEERLMRLAAYEALLEVVENRLEIDLEDLDAIDWEWVRKLPNQK
jgi:HEAT repeats